MAAYEPSDAYGGNVIEALHDSRHGEPPERARAGGAGGRTTYVQSTFYLATMTLHSMDYGARAFEY